MATITPNDARRVHCRVDPITTPVHSDVTSVVLRWSSSHRRSVRCALVQVIAGMSDKLPLSATGAYARRVEAMGFDALHVPETLHDSMSVALLALDNTTRLTVRTSVTLAFVRSPMLLALQAWTCNS